MCALVLGVVIMWLWYVMILVVILGLFSNCLGDDVGRIVVFVIFVFVRWLFYYFGVVVDFVFVLIYVVWFGVRFGNKCKILMGVVLMLIVLIIGCVSVNLRLC